MTEKLPTGVLIDGVVNPCSDDQNSLSSISQYHQCRFPQPESTTKYRFHCRLSMTKKFPIGVLMDDIAISCSNYANLLSSIPQYHQYSDFGLPQPESTTKYGSHRRLSMTKKLATGIPMDGVAIP